MKSKNIRLGDIFSPLGDFLRRFHMLLFFLVVSGGLFAAIMVLISIISVSSNTATSSDNAISGSFDEETIQQVEHDTATSAIPGSRQSPFVE